MGLLDPINLLYLLSLAVLVAIYLRARARPTLEVSSLLLFEEAPAPLARARRLHTDLLFWLEVVALGALSLAIAGLYMRVPQPPAHLRRHALIFDRAAAMGAREGASTRLDLARRQALRIVSAAPAGDQFSVIAYALETELVRASSGDRGAVRAAIASLQPRAVAARPAALSAALMRARAADDIELFSDRLPAGVLPAGLGGRLHFHQVGSTDNNLALVSLDPGEVGSRRGHLVVHNFSAQPRLCALSIECEGRAVARPTLMLAPHGQAVESFGPITWGGLVHARIETPDALAADNQRWAYLPGGRASNVLLISPDPAVRDDLARVLLAVDESARITALDPARLSSLRPGPPPDLVVMHDFYDPRIRAPARLLVFSAPAGALRLARTVALSELEQTERAGTLARPLALGPARVLALPDSMEVLARGSAPGGDEPVALAAAGRDARGRLGVIAFDLRGHLLLDPDRTEVLLLTIEIARRLLAPEALEMVSTGDYLSLPARGPIRVRLPDGTTIERLAGRSGTARIRALEAGLYETEAGGRAGVVLANYYDAAESDLTVKPMAVRAAGAGRPGPAVGLLPGRVRPLGTALTAVGLLALLLSSVLMLWREARRGGWRHV